MAVSGKLGAPTALPSGERAPSIHCIGGWVGLRAGQDVVEKRRRFELQTKVFGNKGKSFFFEVV
jgi:hypothetical protein